MSTATLHYVFDPLCGWCYGASPLVAAARERLPVRLHAGGMMTGAQRQHITPQLRQYVLAHDERALYSHVFPGSFPSIVALGEDMSVRAYSRFDYTVALMSLLE